MKYRDRRKEHGRHSGMTRKLGDSEAVWLLPITRLEYVLASIFVSGTFWGNVLFGDFPSILFP